MSEPQIVYLAEELQLFDGRRAAFFSLEEAKSVVAALDPGIEWEEPKRNEERRRTEVSAKSPHGEWQIIYLPIGEWTLDDDRA